MSKVEEPLMDVMSGPMGPFPQHRGLPLEALFELLALNSQSYHCFRHPSGQLSHLWLSAIL